MTGIVAFDIWISNSDRHDENLVADDIAAPRALRVIDHDQALMGGGTPFVGIQRLIRGAAQLGLTNDTGGMRNDFIREMTTSDHFNKWINRIKDTPNWFVDECVREAAQYGLSRREATACRGFLKRRRDMLDELIMDNRHSFPGIADWKISERLF